MTPALWGAITSLSWGTSDYIARFSGRAVTFQAATFGMLLTGSILLSIWVWVAQAPVRLPTEGLWLILVSGVSLTAATLWLYQSIVRGPISIAEPIVASYPVLIVVYSLVEGVRPSPLQWSAMAVTLIGVTIVAISAEHFVEQGVRTLRDLRITIGIAAASSLAYAIGIIAAQRAIPLYGDLQTTWLTRLVSLAALSLLLVGTRRTPRIPARWWPAVVAQGALDSGGFLSLYQVGYDNGAEIAAVAASTYAVVTILLAWIFLREAIRLRQWLGIALTFGGVAVLSL
jgi:drug/metabolite transporter (DMT)-like permease